MMMSILRGLREVLDVIEWKIIFPFISGPFIIRKQLSLLGAFGHCREGDKISVDKIVTEGEVVAEDDAVVVEEQVKKVP